MDDVRTRFLVCRRRIVRGSGTKAIALFQVKRSEFGLADAGGVLQDRSKHTPKVDS